MKKLYLAILAAFTVLPFCHAEGEEIDDNIETTHVVFFPYREAILSSRIDGVVQENKLIIGQKFKRGELLVTLDPTQYQLEIERVNAAIAEQVIVRDFAKEALAIQEDLYKESMTSELELKKARLELNTAEARIKATQINLKDAMTQLTYCKIHAPFDGRIEEITTRSFETLKAGQPLMKIIDDNQLKATMFVPVAMLDKLKTGTEVTVTCTDTRPALTLKGHVYEIVTRADHRSNTIEIRVLVSNKDGKVTAGMTGEFKYARPQ